MGRKSKLVNSFADLKIEKQALDPNYVRLNNQSQRSSSGGIVSPPSICHGSESCGCFCHYAQDDPPPCYKCCQDQAEDYSLAQKVLLGKKDSLSKANSYHLHDYVLRDEFGIEISKYRRKKNKKGIKKVLDDENSIHPFGAKDSLRLRREISLSQVENINSILTASKSVNHRVKASNIFNDYSHISNTLSQDEIDSRLHLQRHRIPTPCRQQARQTHRERIVRDNFGLDVRKSSSNEGCVVS